MNNPTTNQVAKLFGCTEAQVKAQYAKNAKQLEAMAAKVHKTGRKVNGYTGDANQYGNMIKERFFIPKRKFIGNSAIPTEVSHLHWKAGRGIWCHYTDGCVIRSDSTLNDLQHEYSEVEYPPSFRASTEIERQDANDFFDKIFAS
jgi:hypothetical protein